MARQRRTEVEAYSYINSELKKLGWDTRSPSNGGQVYTQNQCLDDPEIKNLLDKKGYDIPDNEIKLEFPPNPELGDLATTLTFSSMLKISSLYKT